MRQRNDTPFELHAWVDPFMVIAPGETVEWDSPIVGCTVLDDEAKKPATPKVVDDKKTEEKS